jgi:hypothetical protein
MIYIRENLFVCLFLVKGMHYIFSYLSIDDMMCSVAIH